MLGVTNRHGRFGTQGHRGARVREHLEQPAPPALLCYVPSLEGQIARKSLRKSPLSTRAGFLLSFLLHQTLTIPIVVPTPQFFRLDALDFRLSYNTLTHSGRKSHAHRIFQTYLHPKSS